MTLFRGYGGDLPLMRWLQEKIWPVEAKLEAEDVYWGTRLACVEMIRTGTARFWDMYWHPEATSRAVRDAGLRATVGGPLFGLGEDTAEIEATALANLEAQEEFEPAGIEPALWPRTRSTSPARSCCAGRPTSPPSAACRSTSTSPRRSRRSRTASPPTACARPTTSTASGCSASAPCSPTASGSTAPSSS